MRGRIALIILLLLGFSGSAWLNVQQHAKSVRETKALRDQLASLKSRAAAIAANQPADTPSPDSTNVPLSAGQTHVSIATYKVAITVVDPISDLVYGEVNYGSSKAAGFTTESLLAKYPECKAGALGTLVRTKALTTPSPTKTPSPASTRTPSNQPFSKYLAGYVYSYKPPYFSCTDDTTGRNAVAQALAALKNQALPTLVAQ